MTNYYIIGRGHNGWHASGVNVSISGSYTEQPPVHWRTEGAAVYDASESDVDAFIKWVLSAPMVNPALEPGQVNKFSGPRREQGSYEYEYDPLDYVAVDIYLGLLRKYVPSVRFGTIVDGEVVWEQTTPSSEK